MAGPVNLQELSKEDFIKFLNSFDYVFSDCDGVVWGNEPYPRVNEFFTLLEKCGKTVHFVSNNSLRSEDDYTSKFQAAEIENGIERLTYPSVAIIEYLKSIGFDKHVYCVACKEAKKSFVRHGFKIKDGPSTFDPTYSFFSQADDPDIGAVAFDSDFEVNFTKLHKAITYLRRPEVIFLNGASDRQIPVQNNLVLGPGVISDMVAEFVKREPIHLGKPGKMFGEFAMKRAGATDPRRVLFIGDMIDQDVALGKSTGFQTLLVLTSLTKGQMLAHETIQPDYYAEDLTSIVPLLENIT